MASIAPLLTETKTLKSIQKEREDLLKKLQRGGVDAHTRMMRQNKLRLLTAQQIEIETICRLGRAGDRHG